MLLMRGGHGGSRTLMLLRTAEPKSAAYASFATWPRALQFIRKALQKALQFAATLLILLRDALSPKSNILPFIEYQTGINRAFSVNRSSTIAPHSGESFTKALQSLTRELRENAL